MIVNNYKKRTCRIVNFAHWVKIKDSGNKDKHLNLAREFERDSDTNRNWYTWNNTQRIDEETRKLGNKRTSGDYPNYNIIMIGQNIKKCPGILRRLSVTQTPLTLLWKTLKGDKPFQEDWRMKSKQIGYFRKQNKYNFPFKYWIA